MPLGELHRLAGVGRRHHRITEGSQAHGEQAPHVDIVVDEQDRFRAAGIAQIPNCGLQGQSVTGGIRHVRPDG